MWIKSHQIQIIFGQLKLWIALARRNFKWPKKKFELSVLRVIILWWMKHKYEQVLDDPNHHGLCGFRHPYSLCGGHSQNAQCIVPMSDYCLASVVADAPPFNHVGSMMGQRCKGCTNIYPILGECSVFAGLPLHPLGEFIKTRIWMGILKESSTTKLLTSQWKIHAKLYMYPTDKRVLPLTEPPTW